VSGAESAGDALGALVSKTSQGNLNCLSTLLRDALFSSHILEGEPTPN